MENNNPTVVVEDTETNEVKNEDISNGEVPKMVTRRSFSLLVDRETYTQEHFDSLYNVQSRPTKAVADRFRSMRARCKCTGQCVCKAMVKYLGLIDQLRTYNVKEDLLGDFVSGLTIGIMRIPQGMAYALLTTLPPIYGLYVSFFPVLIYSLFGTSRHISIGTFAVVSLMVGSALDRVDCGPTAAANTTDLTGLDTEGNWTTGSGNGTVVQNHDYLMCKLGVATALCFMTGVIHLIMGICRLGFVTIYMSYPLTRGLTTGAAIYVFTSQVKYLFGVPVNSYQGPLNLFYIYIDFFRKIAMTNVAAIITSIICIVFMVLIKELVNPKARKVIKMPVPVELIVVIVGTIGSYFWGMEEKFGIDVVGPIPMGIPAPTLPPVNRFSSVIVDAFSIALVSFAINLALVKLFATKHNYKIDANVELVAYGLSNLISSFFNCFASAGSLSRSLVQEAVGGKTQIVGLVASALMLVVFYAIGPLFQQLPKCVLAAIIVVNLKGMFLQFKDLKELWFISIYDFMTWLIVFLAVVFLNVDLGLGVGIAFGLLTVVFRTQSPYTALLGQVHGSDIYKNLSVYPDADEIKGLKIFRFEASLYYANVEHFAKKLFTKTGINPHKILANRSKHERKNKKRTAKSKKTHEVENGSHARKRKTVHPVPEPPVSVIDVHPEPVDSTNPRDGPELMGIHHIIIDCSTMGYIDYMGVKTLGQVMGDYDKVGVNVLLAGCKLVVREMLESSGFYENIPKDKLFLSVHDAVLDATSGSPLLKFSIGVDIFGKDVLELRDDIQEPSSTKL